VSRLADAHWIERNGAALRRRIFSGEPEGQPVSFFSFLALCSLVFLFGDYGMARVSFSLI
jgi:hypothetical protein